MNAADQNRIRLCGEVMSQAELRYTPAGVPVQQCRIRHRSQLVEAGVQRQVELELDAVAVGDISTGLARVQQGQFCCLSGFLAKKSLNSQQLMLHVSSIEII